MSIGEIMAVGFGGAIFVIVLWNMRPRSKHNSGNPEAWQSGEDVGHNDQ